MKKFIPAAEVEKQQRQIAEAEKRGIDVHTMLPRMEATEAFWSDEHSAYFVKRRALAVKKWNRALEKIIRPNAGRWMEGFERACSKSCATK